MARIFYILIVMGGLISALNIYTKPQEGRICHKNSKLEFQTFLYLLPNFGVGEK